MKIADFLAQNPWEETLALLCREPPAREDLSLDVAAGLIRQQRESQIPALIPLMVSPLVDVQSPNVTEGQKPTKRDRGGGHRLREPRRTARLFIEHAIRSGKDLRHYASADLMRLGTDDAALGRLLRLLSIAGDSSRATRPTLAREWRDVMGSRADFGLVLTPMITQPDGDPTSQAIHWLSIHIANSLRDEPPASSPASDDIERLMHWVSMMVREGSQRISELRADA